MQIRTTRERLLATTIICGAAMAVAAPAFAQDAVQEVVVTGSRIPQPNLTSASPLTVVNSQELKLEGTTNVESLLNDLPQVIATQTSQVSNGASGTATVSLRNLGPARTLVLVDGKRIQPGDPGGGGAADLNNIPSALVDRIDVVTGGASSIYGSDAVAGVVNFIMKKNFQGLRIDAETSFDNHTNGDAPSDAALKSFGLSKPGDVTADGFIYDVTAIIGANLPDDKGNVTAYANYRHLDPVLQATRDFADCGIAVSGATNNTHVCEGSSNTAYGRFDNLGPINPATGRGTIVRALGPNGTFVPYVGSVMAYNFNPLNFMQREDDTYHAGYFAHYDLNKSLEVYSDFMFADDRTNAQIAPSGFFSNSGPNLATGYTFNCNNPLITAAEIGLLCPGVAVTPGAPGGATTTQSIRYRFASSPRNDDLRHTDYKVDLGVRGDLGDGWHYDAYIQYGTTILEDTTTGYASETKLQNALNVITVNGVNQCVVGGSCVPLNIFQQLGKGFTQAALNYVLTPAFTVGQDVEQVASGSITGDLGQYGVKSPWASEGVGIALGTEYRREQTSENFDQEKISGDLSGGGGASPPAAGAFDVYELFGEARVPLVSDKPFVKDLTADLAYRFSDYSSAGKTDTYSAEVHYSPVSDLAFRFSYNRAVRAPSAVELFTPQTTGLGGFQDPCSGTTPQYTVAQCANTGLSPALYGLVSPCASAQCDVRDGGNPNLAPEIADTYSLGLVFTPTFFRGFNATIDYFNINIQNVIDGGAGPTTILAFCADGVSSYCSLIHRDAQGTISSATGYVVQTLVNSGSLETRGVDFTANYRTRFSDWHIPYVMSIPGSLSFALVGTYTEDLTFQPVPGQGHYNCVGYFGVTCGLPQPHWKGQLRTSWITPWNATLSLNWRYIGATKFDGNQADPFLGFGGGFYDIADAKIGDYNYFDLSGTYRFRDRYTFRAGINNLFDKDPPIIDANAIGISAPPYGNANTYPGVYDSLGRTIFIGVTADF